MRNTDSVAFEVFVDYVRDDDRGFENVPELSTQQAVLRQIMPVMSLGDLVARVVHSSCPKTLLGEVIEFHNIDTQTQRLQLLEDYVSLNDISDLSPQVIDAFSYWTWLVFAEKALERGDYRIAWDKVRKAHSGLNAPKVEQGHPPVAGDFSASTEVLSKYVKIIFDHMLQRGLLKPVESDYVEESWVSDLWYEQFPQIAGWPFVSALGFYRRSRDHPTQYNILVDTHGQMVFAIVERLNAERNEKRKNQKQKKN